MRDTDAERSLCHHQKLVPRAMQSTRERNDPALSDLRNVRMDLPKALAVFPLLSPVLGGIN